MDLALERDPLKELRTLLGSRVRLPKKLESFFEFVPDQDLFAGARRRPQISPKSFKAAVSRLNRIRDTTVRSRLKALLYLCSGKFARCSDPLIDACQLWVRADRKRTRDGLEEALSRVNQAVPSRAALLLKAQILFEFERNEEGLAVLDQVKPQDDNILIGKAEILADMYNYRAAMKLYQKLPTNWMTLAQRGRLRGMCGKTALALKDFDAALKIRPGCGPLYSWRAEARRRSGRVDEALEDLNRAIKLDPSYAFSWELRGRLRLGRGELRSGLADLNRACRLDPSHKMAFVWRGEAKLKLGDLDGAWKDFERVYPLNPMTSWNAKDKPAAFWSALRGMRRENPVSWLISGRFKAEQGDLREGLAELATATVLLKGRPLERDARRALERLKR